MTLCKTGNIKNKTILLFLVGLLCASASAQEPVNLFDKDLFLPQTENEPAAPATPATTTPVLKASAHVTLADALVLAEQHNPQIAEAREKLVEAQANIKIAKEIPNPQLQSMYGFGPATTRLGNAQVLMLTQTLEVGGKRRARTELAKSQAYQIEAQLESLRQTVRADVRKRYVELVAAQETAKSLKSQEKLLLELVQIAKKRFETGAAPEADVIQASLAHDQIVPLQAQADGRIRQSQVALNTLLGKSLAPEFEIQESGMLKGHVEKTQGAGAVASTLLTPEALLQKAFTQRQDLQAAIQQVDVCKKQIKVTHSLMYPDIQIGGGYAFLPASQKYGNPYTQGVMTTLQATLPIYNNQRAEMMRDKSSLRQSELELAYQRQQIEKDVQSGLIALQTATVNLALYENKLLPASDESTQLSKLSYQVGKTGLANVILAQQAAQQVRAGYLSALLDYQNAVSDLERAIGGPLE
jgi:cobalt-zinc-cadmium efflux system outer membrane protein